MLDPIWTKIEELTRGYHPMFNKAAAYDLVKEAWRMGFDVVRQPPGSDLYNIAMQQIANQARHADYLPYQSQASVAAAAKSEVRHDP